MPKLFKLFAVLFSLVWCFTLTAQQYEIDPNAGPINYDPPIEAMWDLLLEFDGAALSGAAGNAGAEWDGTSFYSTRWASNLIHEYSADGTTLIREFSIPGVTGLRDLAYDGTYFYGGASANTIYQMDFSTNTLIGTIPTTEAVRHIAYDSDLDAFWVGNWSTDIVCISRAGVELFRIPADPVVTSNYGSCYDNVSPGGPFLWVFSQGGGAGSPQNIHQLQLPGGAVTGVAHDVLGDITGAAGSLSIAGGLFSMTDYATGFFTIGGLLQGNPIGDMIFVYEIEPAGGGTVSIAYAREDLDMDFIPDHLGETVTIEGTISSPNYNTGNFNYVIHDGTAGITSIFFGYTGPEYIMGDVVQVTGEITQYNGLTQISPANDADVVFIGTGGALPDFTVLTIAQFQANAEMYEGELIAFGTLTGTGGGDPWPTSGSNANFELTDALGVDLLIMRIDKETDLDENPEPIWPKDVIGFGGQFSTATPPNDGYQLLPRMYSEILPPGTVPVELTSFTARASDGVVNLSWTTATELNNQGFEIQRGTDGTYRPIGFVNGFGTTTDIHNYSFTDSDVQIGTYYYRLKQVDYNGEYAYSDIVQVDVKAPAVFALEQNYPNPFNPGTKITFNLAVDSKVSLKVFDVLGQEVTKLISTNMTAGVHEVNFNAASLNSGVYFYRIDATGVDGTNFTSVKKMILTK